MTLADDPRSNAAFKAWLVEVARLNQFDGCTGVADIHVLCCQQHDFAYHTGYDARSVWEGHPKLIDKSTADAQFRRCNQEESRFRRFSPLAWWRWVAVRLFGRSTKFDQPSLRWITWPEGWDPPKSGWGTH